MSGTNKEHSSLCTPITIKRGWEYLQTFKDHGDVVPTAAGLALAIGVSRKTVFNWVNANREGMAELYETLLATQERILVNRGLTGEFNQGVTKMMLSNNFGYSDRQQFDHISSDSSMTPTIYVNFGKDDDDNTEH